MWFDNEEEKLNLFQVLKECQVNIRVKMIQNQEKDDEVSKLKTKQYKECHDFILDFLDKNYNEDLDKANIIDINEYKNRLMKEIECESKKIDMNSESWKEMSALILSEQIGYVRGLRRSLQLMDNSEEYE